jgi:hypothetical protein
MTQQHSEPDPISYTLLGASAASGVSPRQLARDAAAGKLVSFRVGRRRLVFKSDLLRYLRGLPPSSTADQPPASTRPLDDGPLNG